jgi:hypothetical protein
VSAATTGRLPKAEHARIERAMQVGRDGLVLLEAVDAPDTPVTLAEVEAAGGVAGDLDPAVLPPRRPGTLARQAQRPAARAAGCSPNPDDPDARPGGKRGRTWRGYKAHCTETCEPDRPHPGHARGHHRPRPPPTWTPSKAATPTSPPATCCPRSTWSTRATSASGSSLLRPPTMASS